jgi:hypothetical protein
MTIKLQFVCQAALSSRAIAWFSSGHLSHVDVVLPNNGYLLGSRDDSVGDRPPGVQIRRPDYARFTRKVVMDVPCGAAQEAAFYEFLYNQVGKPYDTTAIWGFLVDRNWRERDSWICSELVAAAGEDARILPRLYLAANKITPVACALAYSVVCSGIYEVTA